MAEEELKALEKIRSFDAANTLAMARENATMRVALREIQEASNWVHGAISPKLG